MIKLEKVAEVFGFTPGVSTPESTIKVSHITEYAGSESFYGPKSGAAHLFRKSPELLLWLITSAFFYEEIYTDGEGLRPYHERELTFIRVLIDVANLAIKSGKINSEPLFKIGILLFLAVIYEL